MTTIFSGSCEERFHSVPEAQSGGDDSDGRRDSGGMNGRKNKIEEIIVE